jgi:site-specific recombinase XerD
MHGSRRTATGTRLKLVPSGMKTELSVPAIWTSQLAPYRNWLTASGRPSTTIYLRLYHVRRFAVQSGLEPFEPTLDDLLEHLSNPAWGGSARRAARASLRKFYSWAHVTGRMDHNPAGLLPPIAVPKGMPRVATDAGVELGLSSKDPRVPLMVELGDRVGTRCCEIAVVHSDDVRGSAGDYKLLVHGKGGRLRLVDISDSLALRLLEHDGYVFPGRIDGHLSAGYVSKLMSRELGDLDTAHKLRHRAITRVLRNSKGQLRVAQEFAGHASSSTTDIYTAVAASTIREAVLAA